MRAFSGSSNPMFRASAMEDVGYRESYDTHTMSIQGTAAKTGILVLLAMASGLFVWTQFTQNPPSAMPWMMGGLVVGFILAIITCFKPNAAPVTAPLYALAEGLCLGGLSAFMESVYPGIALQAFCLTFGILFTMSVAYQSGTIRATDKFKRGMMAALGGVLLLMLTSFILRMFGMQIPYIYESGIIGIGFSIFMVVLASLMLIWDFDVIENLAAQGAPKSMEWYGAFSLMVTLVWLYIEVLRLLSLLQGDD